MRTDEERLNAFCQLVDEAVSRRAIKDQTITAKWSIHCGEDTDGDLAVDMDLGDTEDLRSLLLDFRKFLADGEDVFFNRVANIVGRAVTDPELHDAHRQNREAWKQVLGGDLQLVANDHIYTRAHCFDIMVNGKWFHGDADKAAEFDHLPVELQGFVLSNVNALVIKGLGVLHAERNLIRAAFDRNAIQF